MIALKYINKNAATVAAIRDYEKYAVYHQQHPAGNQGCVRADDLSQRSEALRDALGTKSQGGADKLAAQIDKLDILRERYQSGH